MKKRKEAAPAVPEKQPEADVPLDVEVELHSPLVPATPDVLVQDLFVRCPDCGQALGGGEPGHGGHVFVTLKQDVILNGVKYTKGGSYFLPEDAFGIWKFAV